MSSIAVVHSADKFKANAIAKDMYTGSPDSYGAYLYYNLSFLKHAVEVEDLIDNLHRYEPYSSISDDIDGLKVTIKYYELRGIEIELYEVI